MKDVREVLARFQWGYFEIALRDSATGDIVPGVVRSAYGVWVEYPDTRAQMFKLTHLPTGLCLRSSSSFSLVLNIADKLQELGRDIDPWEMDEDHLIKVGTLVRDGTPPGPINADYKLHGGKNTAWKPIIPPCEVK